RNRGRGCRKFPRRVWTRNRDTTGLGVGSDPRGTHEDGELKTDSRYVVHPLAEATQRGGTKGTNKNKQQTARSTGATGKTTKRLTAEEGAAMKSRAQELKSEARSNKNRAEGERDVLVAIAATNEPDRSMAKRLHTIMTACAPALGPKIWYGMP